MLRLAFVYARHSMEMQNLSGFGIKDCLTEPGLDSECFGTYRKDREVYTFNDKYLGDFIRKSIKGRRCGAFTKYFESKQFDGIMFTIEKQPKLNDNEISNNVDEDLKCNNTERNEFKIAYENGVRDYRKMNNKKLHKFLKKNWEN